MNRRQFVRGTLATAAGAISLRAFPHELFAATKPKQASDVVTLGPKGVRATRLALGTGTNGTGNKSDQTRGLGDNGVASLFKLGYDNGVTFWDSGSTYGSHPAIKEALKTIPRDKVTIMTKTEAKTEQEMRADLDRFRQETGAEYFDILLLHCLMRPDWPQERQGAMNVLSEAQEKGIVRTHGVSCHTLGALKTAAKTDWVQVDLARINPAGPAMDADPGTVLGVLHEMKAAGKGVIGMKILGAGALAHRSDECFQWALAQDCVDCFTLGMRNPDEFNRTIKQLPAASMRA